MRRRLRAWLCRLLCGPRQTPAIPTGRALGALIDDLLDDVEIVDPASIYRRP